MEPLVQYDGGEAYGRGIAVKGICARTTAWTWLRTGREAIARVAQPGREDVGEDGAVGAARE